jgi:glycosyltransferase involved in cell wall biosynthesis
MNILFLNTTGGFFGGVEQNIALAAKGLTELGHVCSFAYAKGSGIEQDAFNALFTHVWDVGKTSLIEVIQNNQIEVVYIHKWESIEKLLSLRPNVRLVRMVHDHDLYCPRRHKYYAYNRSVCTHKAGLVCYLDLAFVTKDKGRIRYYSIHKHLKELQRNQALDLCIVGSRYMQNELERNGFSREKVSVLPPCIKIEAPEQMQSEGEPSLIYVGQLIRGKGVDVLLKAHAVLVNRHKRPVQLHIIGTGNDEGRLKDMVAELHTQEYVVFHGWVSHEHLSSYYAQAHIAVVPSIWPEPFGMVGLEAMLLEKPVVGSRIGGIPDWLEHEKTGYLFDVKSVDTLTMCLLDLIDNPKKAREFGKNGRKRALELYSFEAYIQALERLLKGAV